MDDATRMTAEALQARRRAREDAVLPADLVPADLAAAYAAHLALLDLLSADGVLQYGCVLGEWNPDYDPLALDQALVKLQVDGETNGFMPASEVLGHPLAALAWLSDAADRHGIELRAGDVILTGAICPAQHLDPGQMAEVAADGLGDIRLWVD